MAAMHKQIVVSLADLRYVSIQCHSCGSSITLDMGKSTTHQAANDVFLPKICTACRAPYDSAMGNVDELRRLFQYLGPVADRITFRGELESSAI